jgi:hypothetical protein
MLSFKQTNKLADGPVTEQEGGSFVNQQEARFITYLVTQLIRGGVEAREIGVICLYKAQVVLAPCSLADTFMFMEPSTRDPDDVPELTRLCRCTKSENFFRAWALCPPSRP